MVVVAKHPGFRPLLEGRKQQQMKWLVKATRPIPSSDSSGSVISPNPWVRPGSVPTIASAATPTITQP